ncbi:HlyC/CorC family transporter [Budviciaceae bacterium CWB-B4]|uniref:Polyamine export protein n=1 Tax=Limnobaculum xujianqingii TaxID=2738837 RepID=A0A9D7AIB6_9GAMM|nr:hemolysin family protein [Limnobaculum xujianqingii]MBK5073664.1 HlyC/CorC family transporter [Limnobaculum xujianqingii]MBK5176605.1 HlyC/CorC family transporter [Limnobaculum xujianqingii]
MLNSLLLIILLIAISAFFSFAEISLAASRKMRLKMMVDEGNVNAARVLELQATPGVFFTVVQIGINAVAILGGIVGDSIFSPYVATFLSRFMEPELSEQLGFIVSFSIVTSLFILFADLTPKRIGMTSPEAVAIRIINPMRFCIALFRPLVWFFNGMATLICRLFKVPMIRNDNITSDDVYAVFEAGALAGVLRKQEHELIENVFELESRTVPSSMTAREHVVYFELDEQESEIKDKIANYPHSKFLVCNGSIDQIIGYVDSKDLLIRVLSNQSLTLKGGVQIHTPLIVPDTLTLSETLESFKVAGEDFAVILNEYALVVGIITLKDVMTTLMGDLIGPGQEEQIVARDESSWLVDGATPIDDVMRALSIDEFPQSENYETIGGFMMYMLRKIPKRTDSVKFSGYKFEVVDIDSYKIDQLLVTRLQDNLAISSDENKEKQPKETE